MNIVNSKEAFTLALYLAMAARCDTQAAKCIKLALDLAEDLTEAEIAECKDAAIAKCRKAREAEIAECKDAAIAKCRKAREALS